MTRFGKRSIYYLTIAFLVGCGNNKQTINSINIPDGDEITTEKLSISQKLTENNQLPIAERIALYRQLKENSPNRYNFENEDEMTMYGYSLLWDRKVEEAIEVFKLIVEEFPGSSNPYDSLGEAYFANGNEDLSLFNYKKSLALNPDNFNAEDYIERILFPNKKPLTPAEKFAKVYSKKEYHEDLNQLGLRLLDVHPNALKFISKEDFWKKIEEKKALVTDQTTFSEFIWHCSEVIASINCSHTSMGRFFQEGDMLPENLRFPVQVRWVDDRLFVIDPLSNKNKVDRKDEILTINKVPVSTVVSDIYRHIQSQGYVETSKRHFFNTWATAMIPYALGFPENYQLEVKRYTNLISLSPKKGRFVNLNKTDSAKELFQDPSIAPCGEDLCLEILDNNKTAILTISSFNFYPWNNFDVFKDFIDQSFKKINNNGVENLIIDVRFNGGGSQQSSIHLLKYLNDKPFSYYSFVDFENKSGQIDGEGVELPFENNFKGKCYFIIDGNGNSTTGHFMSIVKALQLGTIVGEELGSNHFCSAGQTVCRLSNTKLQYNVANNTHVSLTSALEDETGVLPDHYVTQSIDDYLNNVDAVKEFTLKMIK